MQDVLQHLSDSIEHRNKDTFDVKPFILESSPFTEEFNPKAQMVTQKRFWQQMYHFLQENDVLVVEQEHLSLVVPLSLYLITLHM